LIPKQIFDQVADKSTEGLALASASDTDGAIMYLQWCNKAFTRITGYEPHEIVGQRGTILIGPKMSQGHHLLIIDKLMNWESFSINVMNNRKDGATYWHKMSWEPLSDPETGSRWWLYSLIELPELSVGETKPELPLTVGTERGSATKYVERIGHLEQENRQLQELARSVAKESHEDALTGLSNRRHFEVELKSWITDLRQGGVGFALLYIDLDRFKSINDTLGHYAGDLLLKSVADVLRRLVDATDLIARIGGDEFVILKPLGNSALKISDLADRIIEEIQAPLLFEGRSAATSASIGVAIADPSTTNPEQVVADADMALYHAKSEGRGRWSFVTEEMHAHLILTKQLEKDILSACENREFIPHFQPLIDASTGAIASCEVLVRWAHPIRGLLPPSTFLDVAENMGVLRKIDEIVFSQINASLAYFDASGVHLPRIAVNTSAERLADPDFLHDIKSSGIDPQRLTIEILESVSLEKMSNAVRGKLNELSQMGVTIAIDDFGTGQASILGLFQIKPSILKIDRQFIKPIVFDQVSKTLVSSMIAIGKSLGMQVVAEGIETEEQANLVTGMGCDYLQGYYFGKPVSAADFRDKLAETKGQIWASLDQTATRRRPA